MKLVISRHARNRMRRDQITLELVESVLSQPEVVMADQERRMNAWKQTELGWLRVTFVDEESERVVITVTRRRRGPVGR